LLRALLTDPEQTDALVALLRFIRNIGDGGSGSGSGGSRISGKVFSIIDTIQQLKVDPQDLGLASSAAAAWVDRSGSVHGAQNVSSAAPSLAHTLWSFLGDEDKGSRLVELAEVELQPKTTQNT
jgi:hypothetical protein